MLGDWTQCNLGDVITLRRGYDLPQRDRVVGNIPIVTSSGVTGYHNVAKAKGPGVVTGRYGTLGAVFYVKGDYWPHNTALYVQDFKGNDPLFVSYLLRTLHFAGQNVAGAVPGVNRNYLHLLPVRIPVVPLQRKIAAVLSAYDDLIEVDTRRIRILEQMAQAVYREWFGKVDPQALPEGWRVGQLGDIAMEVRRSVQPDQIDPATPYFGLEHLPRNSIALSEWGTAREVQSTKLEFSEGAILFGKIRPYFHKVGVAPIDGVASSDTIVISPKEVAYFGLVLSSVSSEDFVNHATQTSKGTKMPRADWGVLVKYPILLPPQDILIRHNDFVHDTVELIKTLIFVDRNLRRTRDLLLPRLVGGDLDVGAIELPEEP